MCDEDRDFLKTKRQQRIRSPKVMQIATTASGDSARPAVSFDPEALLFEAKVSYDPYLLSFLWLCISFICGMYMSDFLIINAPHHSGCIFGGTLRKQ